MKLFKTLFAATVFSVALAAPSVQADEGLARTSGCLACHGVDKKILGPSFQEIAAKYKDDSAAVATLTEKVKAGGKGNWGEVPMPPNAHVSDDDIKALVDWVLTM